MFQPPSSLYFAVPFYPIKYLNASKYAHLVGDPVCTKVTKASEDSTRKQHQWQGKANAKSLI